MTHNNPSIAHRYKAQTVMKSLHHDIPAHASPRSLLRHLCSLQDRMHWNRIQILNIEKWHTRSDKCELGVNIGSLFTWSAEMRSVFLDGGMKWVLWEKDSHVKLIKVTSWKAKCLHLNKSYSWCNLSLWIGLYYVMLLMISYKLTGCESGFITQHSRGFT